jgi:hypothetical protein
MIASISCNNSEYREYSFNRGAKFSFEYPTHYKIFSIHTYIKSESTGGLYFIDKLPSKGRPEGFIDIGLEDPNTHYSDAEGAVEYTQGSINADFSANIIERSSIIILGRQAELIVYSHKSIIMPEAPPASYNVTKITREVFFDHSGAIWRIIIDSDEERSDQAKSDFEHILQTFKILE